MAVRNAGRTHCSIRKRVGDKVAFSLTVDATAPNAHRAYQWADLSKVCLWLGGVIVLIGGVIRIA